MVYDRLKNCCAAKSDIRNDYAYEYLAFHYMKDFFPSFSTYEGTVNGKYFHKFYIYSDCDETPSTKYFGELDISKYWYMISDKKYKLQLDGSYNFSLISGSKSVLIGNWGSERLGLRAYQTFSFPGVSIDVDQYPT